MNYLRYGLHRAEPPIVIQKSNTDIYYRRYKNKYSCGIQQIAGLLFPIFHFLPPLILVHTVYSFDLYFFPTIASMVYFPIHPIYFPYCKQPLDTGHSCVKYLK